jgi:hypothetical protein
MGRAGTKQEKNERTENLQKLASSNNKIQKDQKLRPRQDFNSDEYKEAQNKS